ncbi:hypothetical protein FDECE_13075 [Fusarium decemcellulare]|nr:hypothetical protein FDECE_13075 [Fusarium decemcellulare]
MQINPLAALVITSLPFAVVAAPPPTVPISQQIQDENTSLILGRVDPTTISSDGSSPGILVIDYGHNVEGFPTFEVLKAEGNTSILEVTYGESKAALSQYMGDGPVPFAAAMDNYRINRYNITGTAILSRRLIQGAFRYQKFNLSSPGMLVLNTIGVKPTTDTTALTELPGRFECSDVDLTRIWHTGARTVQLTEIPKKSIPELWQVTEDGALVESAIPQTLAQAVQLTGYVLQFDVKPLTGEFGFSVLSDTLNSGIYISCDFLGGTMSAHSGLTNMDSLMDSVLLPRGFSLNEWHTVNTTVDTSRIMVSVDNQLVFNFTQTDKFCGSFGLGAAYGHAAVFRNLEARTLAGDMVYSSTLKDKSFLTDFLMGPNPLDTIVDGSRRDRIAYAGDLDIALAAAFASTFGRSYINGTLELLGSFQTTSGFFIPTAKIQQPPLSQLMDANMTGLIGYSFNLITAVAYNYEMTGDIAFAKKWALKVSLMLDWAHSQTRHGLFSVAEASFGGDWNYYDPPQTGIVSKFNAAYAYSILQSLSLLEAAGTDVSVYKKRLDQLRVSMNSRLWNDSLGAYIMSESLRDGFAQDANSLAILAGIPRGNASSTRILSTLAKELMLPAGPLAFSESTTKAGWACKSSPYASSYHLRAAFQSNDTKTAKTLLENLWAPMADPSQVNYTNCFWETLDTDGRPGLGLGTSLCHGWGAGPTAELIRYVLGIRPAEPGFKKWRVAPKTLDLKWARGRQRTVLGDIHVHWRFEDGLLRMQVEGPPQSSGGSVHLPEPMVVCASESVFTVNGKTTEDTSFTVQPGEKFTLIQERKA